MAERIMTGRARRCRPTPDGHEGVDLAVLRHLVEAEEQAEEQGGGNGGAQIMRHQIGEQLEDHGEGILLAERRVEQAHHAFGQQHEQADRHGGGERLGDLPQDIAVDDAKSIRSSPRPV